MARRNYQRLFEKLNVKQEPESQKKVRLN